ncbi:hypothetical protein U1Q18_052691 [Sarracenia purpurea var. burkii]
MQSAWAHEARVPPAVSNGMLPVWTARAPEVGLSPTTDSTGCTKRTARSASSGQTGGGTTPTADEGTSNQRWRREQFSPTWEATSRGQPAESVCIRGTWSSTRDAGSFSLTCSTSSCRLYCWTIGDTRSGQQGLELKSLIFSFSVVN